MTEAGTGATARDMADHRFWRDHWLIGTLAAWALVSCVTLLAKWQSVMALGLGDTDDNLRLAQVRAWLDGQGWYDLRQYRLAPPAGADIHWSRLPDLPIAAIDLLLTPVLGSDMAERWAVALAPLLPFAIGLIALALIARRIIAPHAWPLALLAACCAGILMPMWMALRIDHHGWQLALLAVALAGLADPRPARGGVTSGIATALSLAIGLEMLIFLALIGGATALFWVRSQDQARRIAAYGASLGGGSGLAFLIFASEANRAPVCDALSPVWLSAVAAAGAALALLSLTRNERWVVRLMLAGIAGAVLAIGFALLWPDCLGRPEGVSPELQALWLDNVQEARPIWRQDWQKALIVVALPLSGLAGYAIGLWRARTDMARFAPLLALAAMAVVSILLLFWQVRTAPAAQLIAVPGAALLGMAIIPPMRRSGQMLVRVFGTVTAIGVMTGLWAVIPIAMVPDADAAESEASDSAEADCGSLEAMAALDRLPPATIVAPVDLSPRLIVGTHHSAIAGPYHRNGEAMMDVFEGLGGNEARLRETVERYGASYVLICPGMKGDWLYGAEEEGRTFNRLVSDDAPSWLVSVTLPEGSPYRLWRVAD